jgi:hypothetical protein
MASELPEAPRALLARVELGQVRTGVALRRCHGGDSLRHIVSGRRSTNQ